MNERPILSIFIATYRNNGQPGGSCGFRSDD